MLNLEPDVLAELAEIPNVVAVKQATADLDQARQILSETDLALYAGNDDLLYPFLELGGKGGVCVASHVAGPQMRRMVDARPRRRHGRREGPGRRRSTTSTRRLPSPRTRSP